MTSRNPAGDSPRHFFAEWAVTLLLLLFGTTTLLQGFVVPTGSMESTVLVGDHLFVDKLVYSPPGAFSKHLLPYKDVERGDIIVFRYPLDIRLNYVKRAIGIPGDRIRIVNKQVYLNGKPIAEPYKQHIRGYIDNYADNFPPRDPALRLNRHAEAMLRDHVHDGELVVPPGHIFAMGDNRDNSEDSRFWGFVPRENIIGKPLFCWWSYDAPTDDWTGFSPSHFADVAVNFFTKTRWSRTFRLVRPHPIP